MNRTVIVRDLLVASVSGALLTIVSSRFETRSFTGIAGNSAHFYGFPFPFQETYYEDLLGTFHRFSVLNAAGDFLVFFGVSAAICVLCTVLARTLVARSGPPLQTVL